MARIEVDPEKVLSQLLLEVTSDLQNLKAKNSRLCNIMDYTRLGPNFAPLGAALGVTEGEADTLYGRHRAIEEQLDSVLFKSVYESDQG